MELLIRPRTTLTGVSSRGFGLKLSDPLVTDTDGERLTTGIAVGAPESNRAYYLRVRPVVRLVDWSYITISPRTIDPLTTTTITLTVKPLITRVSAKSVKLNIRGSVITDSRLRLTSDSVVQQTASPGAIDAPELVFKYNLNLHSDDYRPVDFRVALEYSLDDCFDSYKSPCPVFDSLEGWYYDLPFKD